MAADAKEAQAVAFGMRLHLTPHMRWPVDDPKDPWTFISKVTDDEGKRIWSCGGFCSDRFAVGSHGTPVIRSMFHFV